MATTVADVIANLSVKGVDQATAQLKGANSEISKSGSTLKTAGAQWGAFGKLATGIGAGLSAAVTLPIVGLGVAAVKAAMDSQPWFQYVCGPDLMNGGEDYYFCEKARALGYPIYLNFDVQCGHIGKKIYDLRAGWTTTPPTLPAQPSRQARRAAARRR